MCQVNVFKVLLFQYSAAIALKVWGLEAVETLSAQAEDGAEVQIARLPNPRPVRSVDLTLVNRPRFLNNTSFNK